MASIIVDGDLWDEETGAYLGPANGWIDGSIDSEDKALLFMRRQLELESELASKVAMLETVKANIEKLVRVHQQRLEWWQTRYKEELSAWAYDQLPRDKDGNIKSKTWRSPYGTVSFRSTQPRIVVTDDDAVLSWAESFYPRAIKTTSKVLVSLIKDDDKAKLIQDPEGARSIGFDVLPGGDTVTIKTLVEDKDK